MWKGHTPDEIEAMPAWDFILFMEALPALRQFESPFAGMED